jgi:hypothetical protein
MHQDMIKTNEKMSKELEWHGPLSFRSSAKKYE